VTIFARVWGQKPSHTKLFFSGKFLGCYIEAAQNFVRYVTIFAREWGQKTSFIKLVLKRSVLKQSLPNSQDKLLLISQYEGYIEAAQNFIRYVTIFARERGQKSSLTKLGLKRSVLKQSLPNSQHKLFLTSQYEGNIEAAQNFVRYVTIFARERGQKSSLTKLVLKRSVLKQSLPNSQHKLFLTSQYEGNIEAAQNCFQGLLRASKCFQVLPSASKYFQVLPSA
jgi:hypothetical protein